MLLILRLILSVHYATSVTVHQSPGALTGSPGENVKVKCIVEGSTTTSYNMFWYRQNPGEGPQNIIYSTVDNRVYPETPVAGFTAERPNSNEFYLMSAGLEADASAGYFCACANSGGEQEAYFGSGTKLVVLDPNLELRSPEVTILQPSDQEINSKGKATVVCLITDFYPDNIKIRWLIDGFEQSKDSSDIQMDPSSQTDDGGKTFSISSRIRLDARDYAKAKQVMCEVDHYKNGSKPQTKHGTHNIKHETCGLSKEAKTQTMEAGKLTYLILICKSILYGIIASVLACKGKTSYNTRFD